jgi:hypothetical protein
MKFTSTGTRKPQDRARRAVTAVLPRSADIDIPQDDRGVDLIVNGVPVQIKWIGEGGLRQVRDLLGRTRKLPDIVAGRRLSPGARDALIQAGVGWVDETGAAEVSLPALVISRSGHPDRVPERELRWNASTLAVAEALLCGTPATVSATKAATALSAGTCATALRTLSDLRLLEASARRGRASGRRVHDPDRLLDAYAAATSAVPPAASIKVGVAWRDPVAELGDIGRKWQQAGIAWAATGVIAAAVIAPYLTSVHTADVYVDAGTYPGLQAAAEAAGLRPMEGGRLIMRPFPTVSTQRLATVRDDLRVAPWPRVYADLRVTGVRGEEAAEHLREVLHGT